MDTYPDLWDVSDGYPQARAELERLSRIEGAVDQVLQLLDPVTHAEEVRILKVALGEV